MLKKISIAIILISASVSSGAFGFTKEFNRAEAIQSLQNGGMVVVLRHAYAPGSGDPAGVEYADCNTQRNIKSEGKRQAAEIGKFLTANDIVVERAMSSPMCRCWQTGTLAGLDVEKSTMFANKKHAPAIQKFIKNWDGKGNLFIFTHFTVMNNVFPGYQADSGSMLVLDNTGNKITRVGSIHFQYDLMIKD